MAHRRLIQGVLIVLAMFMLDGCGVGPNQSDILTQVSDGIGQTMTEVVGPAIKEGLAELGARTMTLQGSGAVADPGYEIDGYAGYFMGAHWKVTIRAVGINAELTGALQTDSDTPTAPKQPIEPGDDREGGDVVGPPTATVPGGSDTP